MSYFLEVLPYMVVGAVAGFAVHCAYYAGRYGWRALFTREFWNS